MSFLTDVLKFFYHHFTILVKRFAFFVVFISSLSTPISGECTNNKN